MLKRLFRRAKGEKDNDDASSSSVPSGQNGRSSVETASPTLVASPTLNAPTMTKGQNLGLTSLAEPADAIVDIVFVHGLTGNAYNTWYHEKSSTHWPSKLLPDDFSDARIFAFGYDAGVAHFFGPASSNRVGNHAENLLGYLSRKRIRTKTEERPIIFVTHSLGGLVVQNALVLSNANPDVDIRKIERSTLAIAFLGTPHHGSDWAAWGTFVSNMIAALKRTNKNIVAVLKPDSEVLAIVQSGFHRLLARRRDENTRIEITCFYEELPLTGLSEVVPKHSAIIPEYKNYGLVANHMDMTKFHSKDDPGYDAVSGEIFGWMRKLRPLTSTDKAPSVDEAELLKSLGFEGISQRQERVDLAHAKTFEWIWSRESIGFTPWLQSGSGIFWISGKPGSGKSTMMKHIVDDSRSRQELYNRARDSPSCDGIVIATYFLDYKGTPLMKSMEGMLRSILYQILIQQSVCIKWAMDSFLEMKQKRLGANWSLKVLGDCLNRILNGQDRLRFAFFVDALDEYQGEDLLIAELFTKLSQNFGSRLQICVSSRPHPDFKSLFGSSMSFRMESQTVEDVRVYVESKFRVLTDGNGSSYQMLTEQVVRRAQGLFIWVKLASNELARAARRGEDLPSLIRRLDNMPEELDEFYQRILDELSPEEREEAQAMISIVMNAQRVMGPVCLRQAVHHATGIYVDLDDARLAIHRLEFICQGLLEISESPDAEFAPGRHRESGRVVQLAHQTVYSFLTSKTDLLCGIDAQGKKATAQTILTRACVRSLVERFKTKSSRSIKARPRRDGAVANDFFSYAVQWWALHAQRADSETGECQDVLYELDGDYFNALYDFMAASCGEIWDTLDLFCSTQKDREVQIVHGPVSSGSVIDGLWNVVASYFPRLRGGLFGEQIPLSLIELAIALNLENFADDYIRSTTDVSHPHHAHTADLDWNQNDGGLLYSVARGGSLKIARNLLDRGARVSGDLFWASSALCRSLYFGHVELAELLLQHGAQVNRQGVFFNARKAFPAQLAIKGSNATQTVRLLCSHGLEVNSRISYWGSALQYAAKRSNQRVIQILVRDFNADVNISLPRSIFGSALEAAIYAYRICLPYNKPGRVQKERFRTFEFLLCSGADPNAKCSVSSRSLLEHSFDMGLSNVFLSLLRFGAKADCIDAQGHTFLFRVLTDRLPRQLSMAFEPSRGSQRQRYWEALLEHGAALNAVDLSVFGVVERPSNEGWSQLCYQLENQHHRLST